MAAIPPPGGPATGVPSISHQNFASLYADASKYPLTAETIRGPMNLMTISSQGVGMDGPTTAQQVVNSADTMPQAWMVLFTDPTIPNDVGRIHTVHCLTLFAAVGRTSSLHYYYLAFIVLTYY